MAKNRIIEVKTDIFNISKRINKIINNSQICYDLCNKKYLLINKITQKIIFSLPYDVLDERSVDYVLERTRKTNDDILSEMNKYNKQLFEENKNRIKESAINCAEKVLRRESYDSI